MAVFKIDIADDLSIYLSRACFIAILFIYLIYSGKTINTETVTLLIMMLVGPTPFLSIPQWNTMTMTADKSAVYFVNDTIKEHVQTSSLKHYYYKNNG